MGGLLQQEMRRTYAAQRGVSQGASITLAAVSGGFQARFECARRCAEVLGTRNIFEGCQNEITFLIPMEDAHKSITKLAETFSVALVDTVTDEAGTRFVLVWKIIPTRAPIPEIQSSRVPAELRPVDELDEY